MKANIEVIVFNEVMFFLVLSQWFFFFETIEILVLYAVSICLL